MNFFSSTFHAVITGALHAPHYLISIEKIDGQHKQYLTHQVSPGAHTAFVKCIINFQYSCGDKTIKFNAKSGHTYQPVLEGVGYNLNFNAIEKVSIKDITKGK